MGKSVEKGFRPAAGLLAREIDLKGKSVLDVGTGTGAWASLLKEKGAVVTGIDHAEKMLAKGKKRYGDTIRFIHGDGSDLKIFPDGSFDMVTASYVLHGMNRQQREPVILEMKRVSNGLVVFNDFDIGASPFALFLEWLEKSDYHNFARNFHQEMADYFDNCRKIPVSKGHALYIGHISRL